MLPSQALKSTLTRLSSPLTKAASSVASYQPYAREALAEEQQQKKRFQPLQMVLDLLQRGQYLTANMADEIEESFRNGRPLGESTVKVLQAAWQGITGQRKGDWETLLFGGNIGGSSPEGGERAGWIPQDVQEKLEKPLIRWGKEGATGLAEGILRPSKMIGLGANILLDPTTYISFGATTAARTAATKYADDVVRLTLATMKADDFAKLGLKASERAGKSIDKLADFITKAGPDKAKRFMTKTYDDAYKFAIRNPETVLLDKLTPELERFNPTVELTMKPVEGGGFKKVFVGSQPTKGMEDLIARVGEGYAGAGQRKVGSFMGKEFGVSERYPSALRQWDQFKARFEKTAVGEKLSDAWWAVMNRGTVGKIRKALGFRNPYQQMLHLQQRDREMMMHAAAEEEARTLKQVFSGFDEDIINKHKMLRMDANDTGNTVESLLTTYTDPKNLGPGQVALHDIEIGDVQKIKELDAKINEITGRWFKDEEAATLANNLPWDATERVSYFPQQIGKGAVDPGSLKRGGAGGTGPQGFKQQKKLKIGEDRVQANAQMFKYIMGDEFKKAYDALPMGAKPATLDEYIYQWVIDKNLAETTLDLEEALSLRAIDHAKYMAKQKTISDLRQFGISVQEAANVVPDLEKSLNTWGSPTSNLGLYRVDAPGLDDLLFDSDVADIIQKAGQVVSTDQSIQEFASTFAKATAWWKGWVTLSTGFHARNAISNNVTGFLKFGPRWFADPKKWEQSVVGTVYALHPEKYQDLLTKAMDGATPGWIRSTLESNVAGTPFSLRELADYLRSKGTISSHTQVAEEIGKKAGTTLNPFSTRFKGFDISRSAGDVIENQSKFLSFLFDYSDLASKQGGNIANLATDLAGQKQLLEYANREARKWFIDYGDLTDFEKTRLKKVIPFYTWIRKNLANQISGLALYPNMYSVVPKVRGAVKNDDDFDYQIMPEYMENLGYYPIGKTAAGNTIMRWANIPLEDVNKIPLRFEEGNLFKPRFQLQDVLDDVVSNAHPLLKSFIELATGKDLFRKRDIKGLERAPELFQYLNNAPKVVSFLDGIMRKAGVREGLKVTTSPDGKTMMINGTVARMLENNMPVLKVLNNIISAPVELASLPFPNIDDWVEKISGKKDYYEGLNEVFNLISQWAGFKFKEVVDSDEASRREQRLLARAEELKAEAAKSLPGYQQRRAKALKARETRASRLF